MTPRAGWRPCDFSLLETRNLCTHIICPISNFRFHMAGPAMWVTRQIATHTGRTVALIDYLSAVAPPFSYRTVRFSWYWNKWSAAPFSRDDPRGREETPGKEPRLRPNVGRSEVRLSRWTSSRLFQTSPGSFSSWQKRMSSSDVPAGMSPRIATRFQFIRDISSGVPQRRRAKVRRCIWISVQQKLQVAFI